MMDGYQGDPNNLLEKLKYATQSSSIVDLYWGEVMELLRESRDKIEELTSLLKEDEG
jgi:hypothetical protein